MDLKSFLMGIILCNQVGAGCNYSVYVVRDTEDEDVEEIEEYELLEQEKIEYTEADMKAAAE